MLLKQAYARLLARRADKLTQKWHKARRAHRSAEADVLWQTMWETRQRALALITKE